MCAQGWLEAFEDGASIISTMKREKGFSAKYLIKLTSFRSIQDYALSLWMCAEG